MVITFKVTVKTTGNGDVQDITLKVQKALQESKLSRGTVTVFVTGSTAGLTTIEYEPGLVHDLNSFFEKAIPSKGVVYRHNERWSDDNGHSHIRASLLGPSLTVPFVGSSLLLGTWQQIVLVDFDIRPRSREIVLQFLGE